MTTAVYTRLRATDACTHKGMIRGTMYSVTLRRVLRKSDVALKLPGAAGAEERGGSCRGRRGLRASSNGALPGAESQAGLSITSESENLGFLGVSRLANRFVRPSHWLFAACTFVLPACTAIEKRSASDWTVLPVFSPVLVAKRPTPVPFAAATRVVSQPAGESRLVSAESVAPVAPTVPSAASQESTHPITLSTALALSNASPLDVQIAGERVRLASAQLDRARVQWLPNVNLGVDYFRHDGQIQDIVGNVFPTSRSSILLGGGRRAPSPGNIMPTR